VSDAPNIAELRPRDRTGAERARRYRRRKKRAESAPAVTPKTVPAVTLDKVETSIVTVTRDSLTVNVLALAAAASLAGVSAFFAITGMTAIYSAAAVPIMVMTGVIEASKLAAVAWLGHCWSVTPLLLRSALVVIVMVMMALTAVGTFGFLTRAHLDHVATERRAVDEVAVPIAEQVRLAEAMVADLDHRIAAIDGIVAAATAKGSARTAVSILGEKAKLRAGSWRSAERPPSGLLICTRRSRSSTAGAPASPPRQGRRATSPRFSASPTASRPSS